MHLMDWAMKSNYKRLGNYIRLVDERNTDLKVGQLLGVNMTKNFMPTVANMSGLDLSRYKIVRKGRFACNIMHVGRDERLPVSLYAEDSPAIVSPAYMTFEVINPELLLPEFLMMIFQRAEFDRFTWFVSDSSVRGGLEWERFCEIEIPIPEDIEEQKKYVSIYNGLLTNQQCYEKSLNDLHLICDTFMETLVNTEGTKVLGSYIKQSEERNYSLEVTNLLGVSVEKRFFPSKTKQDNLEINSYKIVRKRQFGYVTVTSRNGEKISIALLEGRDGIVSSTYVVFDVIDKNVLLPEFLFLWFKRAEFDRYTRFNSWGSARETFDWADMCAVKLPVPDVEIQKSIVAMHHTLETRKRVNAKLKEMIVPLCPILMRGVINNLSTKLSLIN
jgi:type I restriction enzyme S subunit